MSALHVSIDFVAASGERVTSISALNDAGQSIAIADFWGDKLGRAICVGSMDKAAFVADATELRSRSITFRETKLP